MAAAGRQHDVVVWGATGFTGKLVAEYFAQRYGFTGDVRWALGGRSRDKLEALRGELATATGASAEALPIVLGDGDDEASMNAVAACTKVVCTTAGPYQLYGSKLVAACASQGTHYCDLTGEVSWMRRMIDEHHANAEKSGARIVFTCGFDSIPSDLGVWYLQREMQSRHGARCSQVQCRLKASYGGFSGGTLHSGTLESKADPALLQDPYGLNPTGSERGPDGADIMSIGYDKDFKAWRVPFMMAGINTRVVRRSNALLSYAYGQDFRYDEAMLTGSGFGGLCKAIGIAFGMACFALTMTAGPLQRMVARRVKPGTGPSKETIEKGFFDFRLIAWHATDPTKQLCAKVTGDRDPGYGSTAKMLAESAVCMAKDQLTSKGGCLTPAVAMGDALLERLQANAGLSFSLLE